MTKILIKISNFKENIKHGFSMLEVIIGVTLFTIFFTTITFCFVSLVRMEAASKENIYKKLNNTNEISKKYYIQQ